MYLRTNRGTRHQETQTVVSFVSKGKNQTVWASCRKDIVLKGGKAESEFNQGFSSNPVYWESLRTPEDTQSTYPAPQRAVSQTQSVGHSTRHRTWLLQWNLPLGREEQWVGVGRVARPLENKRQNKSKGLWDNWENSKYILLGLWITLSVIMIQC